MRTITKKHIDLSNYEQKDLKLNTNDAGSLAIQCIGINGTLTVLGKNSFAEELTSLSSVSSEFKIHNSITTDGIYTFDVSGIDNIELSYDGGLGDIYIKVVD